MLEEKALGFLRELGRRDGELGGAAIDEFIFNYLLTTHLLPVYAPKKWTQNCLFIGVGQAEVIAVKYFLRKNYDYGDGSVFVVGVNYSRAKARSVTTHAAKSVSAV